MEKGTNAGGLSPFTPNILTRKQQRRDRRRVKGIGTGGQSLEEAMQRGLSPVETNAGGLSPFTPNIGGTVPIYPARISALTRLASKTEHGASSF